MQELSSNQIDIAFITEPYINKRNGKIPSMPDNYLYYISSQNSTAAIILNKAISHYHDQSLSTDNMCVIHLKNKQSSITLISLYLSPTKTIDLNQLDLVMIKYGKCALICTDANIHSTLAGYSTSDKRAKEVEIFTTQHNLTCHNIPSLEIHTHNSTRGTKTTVDYTFSTFNLNDKIMDWNTDESIEILSDHVPITFKLDFQPNTQTLIRKYNLNRTNFTKLNNYLEIDLKNTQSHNDPTQIWSEFESSINKAIKKFTPKHKIKPKENQWWNEKLEKLRKELKRTQRYEKHKYKNAKIEYTNAINEAKRKSFEKFISESNCENDWFIKSRIFLLDKKQNSHPAIKLPDGSLSTNSTSAYEHLLQANFPNLPTTLNSFQLSVKRYVQNELPKITDENVPKITQSEIQTAILSAPPNKAPGLDGIESNFYKKATPAVLEPLTCLFNKIFETGTFPQNWKESKVAFLKKPNKTNYTAPNSYRPISLLSDASKIFERVLNQRLKYHVESQNIMHDLQFGFRNNIAAEQAAFKLANDIYSGFKSGENTTAVFLDVKNAFPSVWPDGLVYKLLQTKIPKCYTKIVHDYLQNRSSTVLIDDETKITKALTRGLPQGSVLSPILWNLFSQDLFSIAERQNVKMLCYADDSVIYITSKEDPKITETKLNKVLNLFYKWSRKWLIDFSPTKTKAIVFSRKYKQEGKYKPKFTMNGDEIELVQKFTYLGIVFDTKLNWKDHLKEKISKTTTDINKYRALCKKHFGLPAISTKLLIERIITPALTYGALVWSPALKLDYNLKTLKQFDRAAGLAITNCYRTAGTDALLIISGLTPVKYKLEKIIVSSLFNILSNENLNKTLEIDATYSNHQNIQTYTSSLQMALMLMDKSLKVTEKKHSIDITQIEQRFNPRHLPHPATLSSDHIIVKTKREAKEFESNHNFKQAIYTDASRINNSNIGHATLVIENNEIAHTISGALSSQDSVFHGELTAVAVGVRHVIENELTDTGIFCDSFAVVSSLAGRSVNDRLVTETRHNLLIAHETLNCKLIWIPAHSEIHFNELADNQAKLATHLNPIKHKIPKCEIIRKTNQLLFKAWENEWQINNTCRHTRSIFKKPKHHTTIISSKILTYKERRILFLAASGHFPCRSHLFRIGKQKSENCKHCSEKETLEHILKNCPLSTIGKVIREDTRLENLSLEDIFNNEIKLKEAASILEEYVLREDLPNWRNVNINSD